MTVGAVAALAGQEPGRRTPLVPGRFGFEVRPFSSLRRAVATFPEIASCVGVRLLTDDDLVVVAPHGLDDLVNGVCRHNSTRVSARIYAERQAAKA